MKQFFIEHRDALLSAVVVILILSLFVGFQDGNGNTGILHAAGSLVDSTSQDFSNNEERETLQSLATITQPIIIPGSDTYSVNVTYDLSDCVQAQDANGNSLPVRIESISRRSGEDVTHLYDTANEKIIFDKTGVYDIEAYTIDSHNKSCRVKISLAVNG